MKKIMLCLALAFFLHASTNLFAQQNGAGRQEAMKAYLKDSVNLSDAMVDSVMEINKQFQPQMRDIFMDQSASQDDKQTKMQALRTSMEARYKAAGITEDQVKKMHDYQDRMRAQMRARSGGGQ